jgi:hypothetical protein
MSGFEDGIRVKGMFRINIMEDTEDGPVLVGDSGWCENQVTNLGFNEYLVKNLADGLTGVDVTHMALGSGGAPAAGDTTLAGEVVKRTTVTAATSSGSKTVRFTATFGSSDSFVTNTQNISNVALCQTSTQGAATIFAGNTYTSSACATNQNVNATYDIIFS